jgi:hypothetical protein
MGVGPKVNILLYNVELLFYEIMFILTIRIIIHLI